MGMWMTIAAVYNSYSQTQPHITARLALERWVDEDDSFALHFPNYLQCCFIVCYVSLIGVLLLRYSICWLFHSVLFGLPSILRGVDKDIFMLQSLGRQQISDEASVAFNSLLFPEN